MKSAMIKQASVLFLLAGLGFNSHATQPSDDLTLSDASACTKPRVSPPPLGEETYERYNIQRRYIDLDGSGTCALMDVWIERLSGSDSPGMRTLGKRFFHFVNKKWVPFNTDLELFPYLLHSQSTRQTYLIVAPDADMDIMVGGKIIPQAYTRGSWANDDPTQQHKYILLPVGRERSQLFRMLSAQLAQRTPADKQTPGERKRILALEFEASQVDKGLSLSPDL